MAPVRRFMAEAMRAFAQNGGAFLGLFAVAVLWAGVLHSLATERAQAVQAAVQSTSNLSRAFEEHIVRSIKAVDQTLLYIRDSFEKDPASFDIAAWTRSTQALTDLTFQISLIDKNGIVRGTNLAPAGGRVDISDREHFRIHLDNPRDDLFISKPVLGRVSHKWSIQMTRKLMAVDGSFDGVIVVSLDPQYLSRFYDAVDLGRRGAVTLVGIDGIVRARASALSTQTNSALGRSLSGSRMAAVLARSPSGTFEERSPIDGIKRVYAFRAVRDFPLVVTVGIALDELLATHESNRRSYIAVATLLTALLLMVTALIFVRQARLARAREQIRASEARSAQKSELLETTLEHMSQGILMVDANRRIQVCNRQAIEKLGLPAALIATNPAFDDLLRWQLQHGEFSDTGNADEEALRRFVLSGGMSDEPQMYERTRPNGTVLEVRSTPLPAGGVVRTYTDITARRENEAVLRAARDEAHRAARAKSDFLAMMSHEIRSPMSGLLGVLELLRGTKLDADQSRMANILHSSSSALLGVLNDILDFSKIEAGALSIVPEATCLHYLVSDLVQPHTFSAASKGITLSVEFDSELPDRVQTDPLRLRQILDNLLSNAVKFTAGGEIGVRVGTAPDDSEPKLRFTLRDTGIGMDADVLGRLFEPFMQADGSTTRNFGGTGLGLCISRRLARMLGGTLDATSRVGEGSVFTLSLPLIPCVSSVLEQPEADAGKLHGSVRDAHILVVDDDPSNRWLLQRQLELLGGKVDTAENGELGLKALSMSRIDLLVTDCHMPRMDGVLLARAVRAAEEPALSGLPIIGLTADVTSETRERCLNAGMTEVAIKPLTLERISHLVAAHLPARQHVRAHVPAGLTPRPESRPSAAFDPTMYHELFTPGDPEGASWLGDFVTGADLLVEELERVIAADMEVRRDLVEAIAHRLAGSSLSVGANRLGEAARTLEHAAGHRDSATLGVLHSTLVEELTAARVEIGRVLSGVTVQVPS